MAGDVSNKTLAILVGVAVVVSVIGLFIGAPGGITGLVATSNVTAYGAANVLSNVVLTGQDFQINLGGLRNGQSNDSVAKNDWWIMNSTGVTRIDLSYHANRTLFSKACAGTDTTSYNNETSTCYQMQVNATLSHAGVGLAGINDSYENWYNVPVNKSSWEQIVEDMAQYEHATIGIKATVPTYEPSGLKNETVLFIGWEHS